MYQEKPLGNLSVPRPYSLEYRRGTLVQCVSRLYLKEYGRGTHNFEVLNHIVSRLHSKEYSGGTIIFGSFYKEKPLGNLSVPRSYSLEDKRDTLQVPRCLQRLFRRSSHKFFQVVRLKFCYFFKRTIFICFIRQHTNTLG